MEEPPSSFRNCVMSDIANKINMKSPELLTVRIFVLDRDAGSYFAAPPPLNSAINRQTETALVSQCYIGAYPQQPLLTYL